MPYDTMRLIQDASRGSAPAVDELLARHLPGLRAFIRVRCSPAVRAREGVSDVAQSVCREILEHIDRFEFGGEAGFRHWLYTTAMRRIQNKHAFHHAQRRDVDREVRPSTRGGSHPESDLLAAYGTFSTPSMQVAGREAIARIEGALDQLTDEQREVIALSRLVGLGHKEIAEHMGRSEGATRVLLHRSLAKLARLLDDEPTPDAG